jgi:secreted PhoX family phosphatase
MALDEVNEYAKVSKITVDESGRIISGELIEDGSGKYERFCSATIFSENGFKNPLFVTNEEIKDGIVVAYDTVTKKKTEMPWLGKFSHENTILVPNKNHKTIAFTTEDGEPNHSQLYMFMSDNPTNFLNGTGQLYVLIGENNITSFQDLQKGIIYNGYFHPVTWNWMTQNSAELEKEVQNLNALDFMRLEDVDINKVDSSIIYITDTGSDEYGERYKDGRLYQFDIIEPSFNQTDNANITNNNNYKVKISILLDGDDSDDVRNPDNIATSKKSIMIQEDLNDYNIIDGGVNARILKYDLTSHNLNPIAIVDQSQDIYHTKAGEWESSGIIEVFDIFGKGYWLLDIQAHTLGESGQLLLMNSPGS